MCISVNCVKLSYNEGPCIYKIQPVLAETFIAFIVIIYNITANRLITH